VYGGAAVLGPGAWGLGCTVGVAADVLAVAGVDAGTGSGVVYVGGNVGVIDECEYAPY